MDALPQGLDGPAVGCAGTVLTALPSFGLWPLWLGTGGVNGVFISTPHPDPSFSYYRPFGSKDVLHCGLCLDRPTAPVLLELCLDLPYYRPDASLVSVPAPVCQNLGIY